MFVEEGFRIRFGNGECIDFYADSAEDKKSWMKVLCETIGRSSEGKGWCHMVLKKEKQAIEFAAKSTPQETKPKQQSVPRPQAYQQPMQQSMPQQQQTTPQSRGMNSHQHSNSVVNATGFNSPASKHRTQMIPRGAARPQSYHAGQVRP